MLVFVSARKCRELFLRVYYLLYTLIYNIKKRTGGIKSLFLYLHYLLIYALFIYLYTSIYIYKYIYLLIYALFIYLYTSIYIYKYIYLLIYALFIYLYIYISTYFHIHLQIYTLCIYLRFRLCTNANTLAISIHGTGRIIGISTATYIRTSNSTQSSGTPSQAIRYSFYGCRTIT